MSNVMNRLFTGAIAGATATVPMTMVMEALHEQLRGEPDRPLPPREITESVTAKAGVNDAIPEPDKETLTLVAHFGYGAACGALFGLMAPRNVAAAVGCGTLFGLGVWAGSYLGWLPALNVRHDARQDPPARNALMIAAHLVWGATAGLAVASGRREEHA
jgi:uncharacterized membrane protein YagU involved in acid resistance